MKKKYKAFTLIEIIIALFIFAIITLITAQVLHRSINVKEQLEREQQQVDKSAQAIILIKRSLSHAVDYIDFGSNAFGAMTGYKQKVVFNQLGQMVIENKMIPILRHTQIYYANNSIIEEMNIQDKITSRTILSNVSDFSINYQDCNGRHFETWNVTAEDNEQHERQLPCTVNMTFKVNNNPINITTAIIGEDIE